MRSIGELDAFQERGIQQVVLQGDLIASAENQDQIEQGVANAASQLRVCRRQAAPQLEHILVRAARLITDWTCEHGVLAVTFAVHKRVDPLAPRE